MNSSVNRALENFYVEIKPSTHLNFQGTVHIQITAVQVYHSANTLENANFPANFKMSIFITNTPL